MPGAITFHPGNALAAVSDVDALALAAAASRSMSNGGGEISNILRASAATLDAPPLSRRYPLQSGPEPMPVPLHHRSK